MRICSKVCKIVLFVLVIIGSSGCTTYNTVQYAQGHSEKAVWGSFQDPKREWNPDEKPKPAYYLLTPVTVPVDIATSPIQFVDFWITLFGGMGGTP